MMREILLVCRRLHLSLWNLSTTELTETPKRPGGDSGVSNRKDLSFSLMLERFNHKCLSEASRAAIVRPIALDVSLVAGRDKSVAQVGLVHLQNAYCVQSCTSLTY